MNRFTYHPKQKIHSEEFSVILVHSEPRKGLPSALINNNGEPLINSQLRATKKAFGDSVDIVIVTGYRSIDIERGLDRSIRIVTNELFEQTDIGHSIYLGIKATTSHAVYLIDGNSSFTEEVFKPKVESHVYIDTVGDTGLILDGNRVASMSYGVDGPKLGKIIYFCKDDVARFLKNYSNKLLLYEIFNNMIDSGSLIWTL